MSARRAVKAPAPRPPEPRRLPAIFAARKARGQGALVTYLMASDPDLATSKACALACAEGGADVLEIGMPFSDPMADGPTIQRASERALAAGGGVAHALEVAAHVRARSEVGLALMGYLNPVLSYGPERFFADAAAAGVDAVILPDLPPEEAGTLRAAADDAGVSMVFLLAPTSTAERRRTAAAAASGFLYFVSVAGVTGARSALPVDLAAQLEAVRAVAKVPVVVGFGISTPDQARQVARLADGAVVGSAIVNRVAEPGSRAARAERVRRFVRSLARAVHG